MRVEAVKANDLAILDVQRGVLRAVAVGVFCFPRTADVDVLAGLVQKEVAELAQSDEVIAPNGVGDLLKHRRALGDRGGRVRQPVARHGEKAPAVVDLPFPRGALLNVLRTLLSRALHEDLDPRARGTYFGVGAESVDDASDPVGELSIYYAVVK